MSKLPELKITLEGVTYGGTFEQDIHVDRTNLDEEFENQPALYAQYAFYAELAKHEEETKKKSLERLGHVLDHKTREDMKHQGIKSTEKMVQSVVETDKVYKELEDEYLAAKLQAGLLKRAAEAISMRRDMLIQMGSSSRVGSLPVAVSAAQKAHVKEIIARNQGKGE